MSGLDNASAPGSVTSAASENVDTGHDYDGIREFDNPLPRWWLVTLYATVVFSIGYWFYYRGAAVFKQNCLACHGDRGQGVVGPNLTDKYFLHGPKAKDAYQVIGTGILEKGMPAWRTVLGSTKVQEVTAFVVSLRGQEIAGRPAQGVSEQGELAPVQK